MLGKVRFLVGGRGGMGMGFGGGGGGESLVIFLQIGKGKPVLFSTGKGSQFFGQGKITQCRFYFVYTRKATSQD